MSRHLRLNSVVFALTCLLAAQTTQACYTCSSGACADGLYRTQCMETYANGQVYCTVSGDACAGGGGPGHEGGLVAGSNEMSWVVFMTASDAAISRVLPSGRDRVEGEIAGESPSEMLARLSGQPSSSFGVTGAVIIYGGVTSSVRTALGDGIKIRLGPTRGSGSDRSKVGGNSALIVFDGSLGSNEVLITQVKLSGQLYFVVAGVQSYASSATRSIERQELVQGINRSQQGLSLGLTSEQ